MKVLALLFALVATANVVEAQEHFIGPGHEARVVSLFAPVALGEEVAPGHRLWGIAIEQSRIAVTLRGEDGDVPLYLVHPDDAPGGARESTSFALIVEDPPASALPAIDAAWARVVANDQGGFWPEAAATVVDTEHDTWGVRRAVPWGQATFPIDGVLMIVLIVVLAGLIAARHLVAQPRWMIGALVLVVASGIAVRLALSPRTFLGAWPWTRMYPNVRAVASGHALGAWVEAGHEVFLTDTMLWTNFAYAAAMPLVLFGHATYLLRDARAGLFAAAAVALLPQHIRYSICEDGFVGSLVLTSLAFAAIHGWLRDPSPAVRWALFLALPFVLLPGYLLRPLNILFILVYSGALLFLHTEGIPRARRFAGLAVVLIVGAVAFAEFADANRESNPQPPWVIARSALEVLFNPRLFILTHPGFTPPALVVLAVAGGVLAYRAGEKRLVGFLVAWLGLFWLAHAVVVQESMQGRYHLHLVVPFLLLGALTVRYAPEAWWSDRRFRIGAAVAGASLLAGPWLHSGFIHDVGYTEIEEYRFVHSLRDEVPERCTVVEYVGPDGLDFGSRFGRIGERPHAEARFDVEALHDGDVTPERIEALAATPGCLAIYEGLMCAVGREGICDHLRNRLGGRWTREWRAPVRLYDMSSDPERRLSGRDEVRFHLARVR